MRRFQVLLGNIGVTLLILAVLALDVVAVLLVLANSEGFFSHADESLRFEIVDPSKTSRLLVNAYRQCG